MGYLLVIKKFVITILVNIFLQVLLSSLGGYFLMMTFLMGIANILVMLLFYKKESRKQKALLSLMLALVLPVIPILLEHKLGDAGSFAAVVVFTFFFVTIPLLLFSAFTFFRKQKAGDGSLS